MKSEKSPNNDTLVSMQDGSSRTLIKPKKPKINISPEDAKYVDGNPTVTIIFTVMEDGSIPESSIKIRPESLLPSEVSDDIKFQLSNWKFQSGSRATASFEFTIKKN